MSTPSSSAILYNISGLLHTLNERRKHDNLALIAEGKVLHEKLRTLKAKDDDLFTPEKVAGRGSVRDELIVKIADAELGEQWENMGRHELLSLIDGMRYLIRGMEPDNDWWNRGM